MATHASSRTPQSAPPSNVRYGVIWFAVTLAIITYLDRVALSKSAGSIRAELHLSEAQMGWVFGAFGVAYSLFEIPTGYLGDRIGPRRVLMRIVLWWSAFTALMGVAFNFVALLFTQLFFGAGEAGCFPNITKAFTAWLPREERVRGQGIVWLAARWGGAATPFIVFQLLRIVTWRKVFLIFGCIGVIWATFFYRWYRDNPRDNPQVNQAELDLLRGNQGLGVAHGPVPWKLFATTPDILMLCVQYFFLSFSWYFYITWLPTFLESLNVSPATAAALNTIPLFLGGIGAILSGFLAGKLTRVFGSVRTARRVVCSVSFLLAAIFLVVSTTIHEPWLKMIVIGFASFFNDVTLPPAWGACMDVGGKFSGTLSGAMNMTGNFGGFVFPVVAPFVRRHFGGDWDYVLYLCAFSYVCGALLWTRLDPVTPVERPDPVPRFPRAPSVTAVFRPARPPRQAPHTSLSPSPLCCR